MQPEYEPLDHNTHKDWKAVTTITLGELIETGYVDFSSTDYNFDSYSDEQRNRFWTKFEDRFYYRDISLLPPGRWRRRLIATLNEVMPKFKYLYQALEDGVNPFQVSDEYHLERNIYSDFPQTRLAGNEDYASNGTDREYETIFEGDFIERARAIGYDYDDVDVMLLNVCDKVFSHVYSTHLNGL